MAHNTFKIEFECSNAAFDDGDHGRQETARILNKIASDVKQGALDGIVRDCNGNTIGSWTVLYHG